MDDAGRFVEILSNWNVIRMVRLAPHPYTPAHAKVWIASHAAERDARTGFRFVIERDGRMIGACDVDEIASGSGDIGYWLDQVVWGRGIASEAAQALAAFGFHDLKLRRLTSGHASDNPASGRVLAKLGFGKIGETKVWSTPRGCEIDQWRYDLIR